mgnify:CR=1 FL=1
MNPFKDCPECEYIRKSLNLNAMVGSAIDLAILYHIHVLNKKIDELKALNFQTAELNFQNDMPSLRG